MQHHHNTSAEVRPEVIDAVAVYAHSRAARRFREPAPGTYTVRFRHDTDGHGDEQVFLAAMAAHPAIAQVQPTTHAEDEMLGVDALITVRGEQVPVPIDVTTRGRGAPGGVANLLATLQRGVIPVVLEEVPTDLRPDAAYAAFIFWRDKSEEFFQANALTPVLSMKRSPHDR